MSKRFYYDEFLEEIYDEQIGDYPSNQSICGILNQQDQRIAELEEQLKKSQNQKAIEELEKVEEEMSLNGSDYCEIRQGTSPHNPTDYAWFNYVVFRKFINNQIKSLKGEE